MEKGFRSSGGGGQQQEDAALADTAEQVGFLGLHFGGNLKLQEGISQSGFKPANYIRQMELVLQD